MQISTGVMPLVTAKDIPIQCSNIYFSVMKGHFVKPNAPNPSSTIKLKSAQFFCFQSTHFYVATDAAGPCSEASLKISCGFTLKSVLCPNYTVVSCLQMLKHCVTFTNVGMLWCCVQWFKWSNQNWSNLSNVVTLTNLKILWSPWEYPVLSRFSKLQNAAHKYWNTVSRMSGSFTLTNAAVLFVKSERQVINMKSDGDMTRFEDVSLRHLASDTNKFEETVSVVCRSVLTFNPFFPFAVFIQNFFFSPHKSPAVGSELGPVKYLCNGCDRLKLWEPIFFSSSLSLISFTCPWSHFFHPLGFYSPSLSFSCIASLPRSHWLVSIGSI